MAVLVCIPTNSIRGLPFLHTLSSIYYSQLFDDDHSDMCEVTLFVALICISLIISSIGQIGAVINPVIPPKKLRRGDQVSTCPAGGCPGVGT